MYYLHEYRMVIQYCLSTTVIFHIWYFLYAVKLSVCSDFTALHSVSQIIVYSCYLLLTFNHRPLFSSAPELKNARFKSWSSAFLLPSCKLTGKYFFILALFFFLQVNRHVFKINLQVPANTLRNSIVFYHIYIISY